MVLYTGRNYAYLGRMDVFGIALYIILNSGGGGGGGMDMVDIAVKSQQSLLEQSRAYRIRII